MIWLGSDLALYLVNNKLNDNLKATSFYNSIKLRLISLNIPIEYIEYLAPNDARLLIQRVISCLEEKEVEKNQKQIKFKKYDVFISHANRDKLEYVDKLYVALNKLGIEAFYDKNISWGDNWKNKILEGTEQSEFAIIVISNNFFDREWTEKELNEFLQRQNQSKQKIILPLLHNIDFTDVKDRYPNLEYIQGIKTKDYTYDEIAIMFAKELIKRYKYGDIS